jgi:quercetin dioxygenase-like cupin family protein
MRAIVHDPGEGETLPMGPNQVVIKAGGEDTAGTFFLSETTLAPGAAGPPPHRHRTLHDMFYVVEGELAMLVGDEWRTLAAGSFVCAPPGVRHTFANRSEAPVRFLNFNTPGGWENYMRDLAAAARAEGSLTPEVAGRVAAAYDIEVVP